MQFEANIFQKTLVFAIECITLCSFYQNIHVVSSSFSFYSMFSPSSRTT